MEGPITGDVFVDWALIAVSLFNAIVMLWLGLTVLLNAERRTWAIWLAGAGLLMGAAFFVSHAALLGQGLQKLSREMNVWWHLAWAPVIAGPFAWYVAMLWYSGFWEDRHTPLHKRQLPWLVITLLSAAALVGLLLFANPLPNYAQVWELQPLATPTIGGIPLLILTYCLYIIMCISLSLDALRHPGPTGRMMGDIARRRARPWLVATSVVLLLVSLLAAWVITWIVLNVHGPAPFGELGVVAIGFDLVIASLIALSVILLGQAVVSYEIFTGKALPRRGLRRQWLSAMILAAGYSLTVGLCLTLAMRPIYSLLLTTLLMTLSYALFNWRSYVERERAIDHLRPFVTSPHLYESLVPPSASTPPAFDAETPFHALCSDLLGVTVAYLVPVGSLAPLVGPGLVYPQDTTATLPAITEIMDKLNSPQAMVIPLEASRFNGAVWAVPLWSERGLIGVLLLGEKKDRGLYAQEEIEIARASGERLIDTCASAELAQRLMMLQRQRMAESHVLDHRARRVLHDDILPLLHTAMLTLSSQTSGSEGTTSTTLTQLTDLHRQISNLLHTMPATTAPEIARLGFVGALRQVVCEELIDAFETVTWEVEPEAEKETEALPAMTQEVLFYAAREALRNAARHGPGAAADKPLHLRITVSSHPDPLRAVQIVIEDDGVGLGTAVRPGGGSGQGLALHSTMMAVVGGALTAETIPGKCTRIMLNLPQGIWSGRNRSAVYA